MADEISDDETPKQYIGRQVRKRLVRRNRIRRAAIDTAEAGGVEAPNELYRENEDNFNHKN